MKNKVDKFDVYKLVYLPVDLSKLSDVVKMMLLKKMHIMLRLKLQDKIHDITNLPTRQGDVVVASY